MQRKVALVCDWITSWGGAERVLQGIYQLYPSPIYTLFSNAKVAEKIGFSPEKISSSFLQKFPGIQKSYRNYLGLFPKAIESFDLSHFDLILSSSHAVAKGIKKRAGQLHICYCHTPVRYAWDMYNEYVRDLSFIKKQVAKPILQYIRKWDYTTTNQVDYFLANSKYIAKRIEKNYQRKAVVIYPPVQTHLFYSSEKRDTYYLTVSRLVSYKKIDLIVRAFSEMPEKRLLVIGEGPERKNLERYATKNVELLGFQTDSMVRSYMSRARGFVFAAEEDFGISPVEAQASGTPVIAFNKGGATETVISQKTGIFFTEQTSSAIRKAVEAFEEQRESFIPEEIQKWAHRFREERFLEEFKAFVEEKSKEHRWEH